MPKIRVPFNAGHTPDLPDYRDQPTTKTIHDMMPHPGNALEPLRTLSTLGTPTTLDSRVSALLSVFATNGTYWLYAGTRTKLYEGDTSYAFTDQSVAGGYSLDADEWWKLFPFHRNNKIIAIGSVVSRRRSVKSQTVHSMTVGTGSSSAFSAMITSTEKPKPNFGCVMSQFVVLANVTSTADGYRATRVHWSAFGDETDFDPSAATQCDYEDLASGGPVTGLVGGNEYGLVFQEEMVRTMRYIGGQTIFDIRPIAYAPGCTLPRSIVSHEGRVFYISQSGFIMLEGLSIKYIGKNRVDEYLIAALKANSAADIEANVIGSVDARRKTVWWTYPTGDTEYADKMLGYKYDEDRWVEMRSNNVETIGSIQLSGYETGPAFVAFNTSHQLCSFEGNATAVGVVETGLLQPVADKRWQLNGVKLIGDGGGMGLHSGVNVSVRAFDRADPTSYPAYGTAVPRNHHGWNPVRIAGNYLQVRASISMTTTVCTTTTGTSTASGSYSTTFAGNFGARWQALELDYVILGDR